MDFFENKDEAEQAKKEIEGIKYIKTKTDMNDPEVVLQVYNENDRAETV